MTTHTPSRSTWGPGLTAGVAFGAAVLATALIGGLASANAGQVYNALTLPSWAPPQWLFGPAWTVLYILIAIAGWLVWRASGWRGAATALTVYAVQLVLNALWTPLFFGAGLYGLALAEIGLLWLTVVATIVLFRRHSTVATALLVPYIAWVTYAGALNFAIWQLN
ncbi:TspO/MBR family protein [Nocardiopsis ansamitocini]|uniref:TspO/MBR-related protein n=1 Tax=Nocardiopsis ansamitocini TaxID=1670832 RepID=A0A9W6UIT0_9ACTN|nr:TspO/MBR family protein [Nocardiopsis ansamitocini]GLU48017.1 putative TspO/MBR-related protein precursor [Nocardiopsis ansamitocini]